MRFRSILSALTFMKPLVMQRSGPDGVTGRIPVHSDAYYMNESLWSEDGSGAVIADITADPQNYHPTAPLLWLPADGSAAVTLPANGRNLRWGK